MIGRGAGPAFNFAENRQMVANDPVGVYGSAAEMSVIDPPRLPDIDHSY